jgi:hypothetical protein
MGLMLPVEQILVGAYLSCCLHNAQRVNITAEHTKLAQPQLTARMVS